MLFHSREAARKYLDIHYGYFRNRPDLRREPFGWRIPKVVRANVRVEWAE
jgi:hypothetical protein